MITLTPTGFWAQPNASDKVGPLWATKNVNLDETGYVKLSPRSVKLLDEAAEGTLGLPVGIGRFSAGQFQVATIDTNYVTNIGTSNLDITVDTGTAEPTLTVDSAGTFFHNYWLASTTSQVFRKAANDSASATWTSAAMSLTSAVNHALDVFDSRNQICVANGNKVQEYSESGGTFTLAVTLTISADYEIVGMKYNNGQMGIITQSGLTSTGQLQEAKFYVWDGSSTSATAWGIGAEKAIGIAAYQSSWVILTNKGELKQFNGGGFTLLAQLPFFVENKAMTSVVQTGDCMAVEGDRVYMNIGVSLSGFGKKEEQQIPNLPSGVYCYDPKVGLYHRASTSNSQAYLIVVNASGADASTNIITATSGTIPDTGNPIRFISGATIAGVTRNRVYFVIKLSSSTFALAETKELALVGTKVDVTATNSDVSRFHAYDVVDYGVTFRDDIAAVALFGQTSNLYSDFIFGGDCKTVAALAANDALCMTVPEVENRGWIITPRIFSQGINDVCKNIFVKFRPLKTNDAIVIKLKDRDVLGLPVSTPAAVPAGSDELIWTGTQAGYTSVDLSEAKAHLDAGNELECEFTAGAGAGQTVKIDDITLSGTTYTVEFSEEIVGAASTRQSYFLINNWRTIGTIDSTQNNLGWQGFPVSSHEKFVQFKIELRGSGTTIEEVLIDSAVDNQAD